MRIFEHFDDAALKAGSGFDHWDDLFVYLTERAKDEKLWIAIDEFPYLSDESPELTSILQSFWDDKWKRSAIKIVLCGSHIGLMKNLKGRVQPLHGRRTDRENLGV